MHLMISRAAAQALLLLVPHPDALASRSSEDPVITRAVHVLSQPVNEVRVLSLPELHQVFQAAGGGSPPHGLIAFRRQQDPTIYISAASRVYLDAAERPSRFHLLRLAATLVHEQVHDTDGEDAAYRRQADFVRSRLASLPHEDRARGYDYWRTLEVRAISLARAVNRRH